MRRILAGLVGAIAALGLSSSSFAYAPGDPSDPPAPFVPWRYSSQLSYGPFEDGTGSVPERAAPVAFLTLPFEGSHLVTSIFDHCGPNYILDGVICRYDGAVAHSANGADWHGYARTKGGKDYLYYDGHDGWDYSLYYEPVLAAAPGVVTKAGWDDPSCQTCSFGQNVFVDHGNGFTTRYAHLSQVWVHAGEPVARGQVVGISGNTGASTGEHLHFGVYRTAGLIPIDPYGWTAAAGADPWPYDAGDLWLGGAPRFATMVRPAVSATAEAGGGGVQVSWQGAGAGGSYDVLVSVDGGALKPWLAGSTASSATYSAAAGHSYWFLVRGTTALGLQAAAMTAEVAG
ncbi:MAG TPA: M23 family metallopeptidase [Candidatus Dormibacteraeota bacterium]